MSEGIIVGLFLWSVAQGDYVEALVLIGRWVYVGYRRYQAYQHLIAQPQDEML
jgi:hypothetical protein